MGKSQSNNDEKNLELNLSNNNNSSMNNNMMIKSSVNGKKYFVITHTFHKTRRYYNSSILSFGSSHEIYNNFLHKVMKISKLSWFGFF